MFELLLQADKALADGSLDQAERTYWQLIDLDPSNAIAVAGLARVALERGDETSARTFADQALAIDPESIAARRVIDTIAHTGPTRGDDAMALPLLAAERLEAMSRRRATEPSGNAGPASDEGAAVPKTGGSKKVASGAAADSPSAGAGQAKLEPRSTTSAGARGSSQQEPAVPMAGEPLRERRKAGRLAAAAAAAAAAAREPVHTRHEPHHAMPLGRRYFETAELKPTQVDEFSEAEMAAAIEAIDAVEEPGASSGGSRSQPVGTPKDDLSDLLGAVEATAPDESVALRLALMSEVVDLDAAERDAAAYRDVENEDDSFEAAEAMASSALHIQPRAPHETRPTYIVEAADDFDLADDFDAAEASAAQAATAGRMANAEADAEAAGQTELDAEAAAAAEAMAEVTAAAADEPEPAPVRRKFKMETESEPSEEAAEAQALREALAQVLAGEPAGRTAGAGYAGSPVTKAASARTVPIDTTERDDTTDTTDQGPATEDSPGESAPRKGGIFRRIRGN